ncbi:MAG: DUF2330 domain-containing protein [Myxococcota bacterium]|nr:DUF2330 domain-containing protein [Myxococcota bacterium]
MTRFHTLTALLSTLLLATLSLPGEGRTDPCGMVPPISVTGGAAPELERTGAQRTWVMFDQGVETIALRPGFEGNVEDFGMLIPFPSPPAIRKISDDTFAQLEAAIDPPTLEVRIEERRRPRRLSRRSGSFAVPNSEPVEDEGALELDVVNVLSEEAVGMYQVAVLEAGSPRALQLWMTDNGYQYPSGMDAVAQDYVDERWCFVAVKARVAAESGVAPRPGLREVDPALPAGASFDGFVQGMGFRFRTEEPVVPMRLSVFNGVDPRNVVYVLTSEAVRIQGVPLSAVVRQVPGKELYRNMIDPIPVEFEGGKASDLEKHEREQVASSREPGQYSGVARDLIAADLMALRRDELALAVESKEKQLLNISEAFGLRGAEIDTLHSEVLAEAVREQTEAALVDLKKLHLTVIDGIFPSEVLAAENLSFGSFVMDKAQNQPRTESIRPSAGSLTFWR